VELQRLQIYQAQNKQKTKESVWHILKDK
jgi:hypothetical protein